MTTLRLAAAILNQTPLDWDGNQARIVATLRAARQQGVAMLCLPELCVTGYGCEDAFHGLDVVAQAERVLLELLPETARPGGVRRPAAGCTTARCSTPRRWSPTG